MDRKIVNISTLTEIANAIREKTDTTDLYALDEMPQVIRDIQTGGGGDYEDAERVRW